MRKGPVADGEEISDLAPEQCIAEVFDVSTGLDELNLVPEEDLALGSIQPVVSVNQHGERQIELMLWGFKFPNRLLLNTRSNGIETAKF